MYLHNGVQERSHGNSGRLPHHGFTIEELQSVVLFIKNYAEENAILLPSRIPGYKRTDLQLLPTNTTKKEVWQQYVMACGTLTFRIAGYRTFCVLWRRYGLASKTPLLLPRPATGLRKRKPRYINNVATHFI